MLKLFHANQLESLLDVLAEQLSTPQSNPFAAEIVVVQNPGTARWLNLQLAERLGILANVEFPLPAAFIWSLIKPEAVQHAGDAYEIERLRWYLMALLPDYLGRHDFAALAHYLAADEEAPGKPQRFESRLYQLSGKIAALYDQYLVFRPDWIMAWEDGQKGGWQAMLWRGLKEAIRAPHRADLITRFVKGGGVARGNPFPDRVSVFGVSSLPPAYVGVLDRLSQSSTTSVFVLNPCREYWHEIRSKQSQARSRADSSSADSTTYVHSGNELLASLGSQNRDFQKLLYAFDCDDHDHFHTPGRGSILTCIQDDLLGLRNGPPKSDTASQQTDDQSLSIHRCHSPLREVQVLHNQLLHWFATLDQLGTRDIVVMAPDISRYEAHIRAVFGVIDDQRRISWNLSDLTDSAHSALYQCVLGMLSSATERAEAPKLFSWIEHPAVARRLQFSDADVAMIKQWLIVSGARWGFDAAHRQSLGLPATEVATWSHTLERLVAGFSMQGEDAAWAGIWPLSLVEGLSAEKLGRLMRFVDRLQAFGQMISVPAVPAVWQRRVSALLDDFFEPNESELQAMLVITELVQQLRENVEAAGFTQAISAELLCAHLRAGIDERKTSIPFLDGRLSFCNMVPMRSLPFRVVCLLGMNDSEFPREQSQVDFDRMQSEPRIGDRSRRDDDRFLFLEALCSAREVLHISYVAHDVKDNGEKTPSVVVSQLLDYARLHYPTTQGSIVQDHSLQAFAKRNFEANNPHKSYATEWLPGEQPDSPFFPRDTCLEATNGIIEIEQLLAFFDAPAHYFLRHRLGINLDIRDDQLGDVETLNTDGLQAYKIKAQLLTGSDLGAQARSRMTDQGLLSEGEGGARTLADLEHTISPQAQAMKRMSGQEQQTFSLNIDLQNGVLRGQMQVMQTRAQAQEISIIRPGKARVKDRLQLWIRSLVLQVHFAKEQELNGHCYCEDMFLSCKTIDNPETYLAELCDLFFLGNRQAIAFFPEASWRYYLDHVSKDKAWEPLADVASMGSRWRDWNGVRERDKRAVALLFRNRKTVMDEAFCQLSESVFAPIFRHITEEKY